ncbi:MAG: penicillin-binding protein, partial [Sphingobium sp.]
APLKGRLAMNFLLDRSAENWKLAVADLKKQVGACPAAQPLTSTGAMSATFRLDCERGKLEGTLLLAPTTPLTVQALRYRVVPQ